MVKVTAEDSKPTADEIVTRIRHHLEKLLPKLLSETSGTFEKHIIAENQEAFLDPIPNLVNIPYLPRYYRHPEAWYNKRYNPSIDEVVSFRNLSVGEYYEECHQLGVGLMGT